MDVDRWTRVEENMLEASIMSRTRQQAFEAHKVAPCSMSWAESVRYGKVAYCSFVGITVQFSSSYKYTDSKCCSSELQLFKSKFQEIVLECLKGCPKKLAGRECMSFRNLEWSNSRKSEKMLIFPSLKVRY